MKFNTEPLGKNIKICTDSVHKFTTDTLLLASFSSKRRVKNALELCCGSGAVSLIWCRDNICKNIYSVDIQKSACELLENSVKLNNLDSKVTVINADLKEIEKLLYPTRFDMIAVNPPYYSIGTGKQNENLSRVTAKHETDCTIEDILRVSSRLLNFSGSFFMCFRPRRLAEVLSLMKKYKIEPKVLQLVQQNINSAPKLFLVKGTMGAKESLKALPTLFIQDESGNYSDEMKQIYSEYLKEQQNER